MLCTQQILIVSNSDAQIIYKNIQIYTDIYFSTYSISDLFYVLFIHS